MDEDLIMQCKSFPLIALAGPSIFDFLYHVNTCACIWLSCDCADKEHIEAVAMQTCVYIGQISHVLTCTFSDWYNNINMASMSINLKSLAVWVNIHHCRILSIQHVVSNTL